MPSPGQILVGSGFALLAYFALRPRKTASTEPAAGCPFEPYAYNSDQVNTRVDYYLDANRCDPATITVDVAHDLFSPHPTGAAVSFPPVINAQAGLPLPGVQCVFDMVSSAVLERMQARAITPCADGGSVPFEEGDANDPGYPWEVPKVHVGNYPTPGMFFLFGQPTKYGANETETISHESGIVRAALGSAMAMAGNFKAEWVKAPPANAGQDHPYFNTNAKRLRKQMARLIRYSQWNDQLYGQTDPTKAGGSDENTSMMEPCGRGLNYLPRHADNIGRLAEGKAPLRTTDLQGNKLASPNRGSHNMQLWLPAVNLERLSANVPDASLSVTTQGNVWSTGDSTLVPPPQVWQKGVENPVGGVAQWGCPGVV